MADKALRPAGQAQPVAVCRPWAPPADALMPYLERIDAARWYSNFGPLAREFEARLEARLGARAHVVTAANGTLALALALRARAPQGGLCIMPAWSFVATAHAALIAGLTPYFADVDEATGALTPPIAARACAAAPGPVSAVAPVLPYGMPIDLEAWAAFESETGVAVVVDAAAGFDAVADAPVPLVVSLHATKALGVGEGGFFAARDADLVGAVRALSVFGFAGTRQSPAPAFNAKLSEYAAAVGLAALDCWPRTRARYRRAALALHSALTGLPLALQPGWGSRWISTTCIATIESGADLLERRLAAAGVETRRWWERGLHRQPAFRAAPVADDLAVTNALAARSLGLPFAADLDARQIEAIARTAADALR
jgi:dTDP-4-amino-4,6-dideoxygalactose transaminase